MTIDEAISLLKQYIDYNNPDIPDFYTMEEAIKVIIEALEQQPCEDCISREKALQIIRAWFDREATPSDLKNEIEQLPSVTAQQKMGRWAILKDEYGDVCEAVCSCCDKNGNHKWAFCPYCGAKMSEIPTGSEGSDKG